jgi:hypothetical protein
LRGFSKAAAAGDSAAGDAAAPGAGDVSPGDADAAGAGVVSVLASLVVSLQEASGNRAAAARSVTASRKEGFPMVLSLVVGIIWW